MIKPVAIDKDTGQHPALDFEFLRSMGITWIQQLAGKSWTDFNLHDPGVTILEVLCFAITELAYRTDFPVQDLLSNDKGDIDYEKNAFFLKEDILTSNPVTINDYRKVIIDEIEEAQNVWLYPLKSGYSDSTLTGLYKIYVQVKPEIAEGMLTDTGVTNEELVNRVRHCFVSRRNLCEDVTADIIILKPVKISIEADILVDEYHIAEETLANVYQHLENSLNSPVRYYSEKELIDQGYSIDEIYSGPFLKKGFIPDSELKDRKILVDPTELTRSISQIAGVLSVKKLKIVQGQRSRNNKPLIVSENSFPLFDIPASEKHIKLYKDNFELPIKRPVFRLILQKIRELQNRSFIASFYNKSSKNIIKGKYRNNERYHTIQRQFPKLYGIGDEGLLEDVSDQRKAQAKQLKAYLLFFEQIMANYLAQLSNIGDVFSIDLNKNTENTYYKKPLYDIPDIRFLLKDFTSWSKNLSDSDWDTFIRNRNNSYLHKLDGITETDSVYIDRKNRFYEHFLARFNEFFTPYPAKLYSSLYEPRYEDDRVNPELKWKAEILKNIPGLGSGRVRAYDYLKAERDGQVIDFPARMRMLLNIKEWHGTTMLSSVLDDDRISFEKQSKQIKANEQRPNDQAEDLSWQNEMPEILINQTEIAELFDQGKVFTGDDIPNDAFLLKGQKASVLRYAIDIQNFRIGPNPAKESGYVLLYKEPADDRWITISRFPSHEMAMTSLKKMIDYLREISINSEGFYLLEHILLRPHLESRSFGFRFVAGDGQRLMEHSKWMSFDEREKAIESLLEVLTSENELTADKLAPLCKINLYAPAADVPESVAQRNKGETGNLFNYFKLYAAQRDKFLSRFEMVIKGEDNSIISEDFFNFRMSVVFPSWPARFQDENFREAAESFFLLNAPAHINIRFMWMGVSRFKKLEALYFDWKRFMADETDTETKNDLRNALVQMLNKY